MTDTERIIEAVEQRGANAADGLWVTRDDLTALVNLAMSGVCPKCRNTERVRRGMVGDYEYADPPCRDPYHDHREALDALLAERGGDSR